MDRKSKHQEAIVPFASVRVDLADFVHRHRHWAACGLKTTTTTDVVSAFPYSLTAVRSQWSAATKEQRTYALFVTASEQFVLAAATTSRAGSCCPYRYFEQRPLLLLWCCWCPVTSTKTAPLFDPSRTISRGSNDGCDAARLLRRLPSARIDRGKEMTCGRRLACSAGCGCFAPTGVPWRTGAHGWCAEHRSDQTREERADLGKRRPPRDRYRDSCDWRRLSTRNVMVRVFAARGVAITCGRGRNHRPARYSSLAPFCPKISDGWTAHVGWTYAYRSGPANDNG